MISVYLVGCSAPSDSSPVVFAQESGLAKVLPSCEGHAPPSSLESQRKFSRQRIASEAGEHPRLYLTIDGVEKLKLKLPTEPYASTWRHVQLRARAAISAAPPGPTDRLSEPEMRKLSHHLPNLGIAYRMTGEKPYLDASIKWVAALVEMRDWASNRSLGAAENLEALAFAYDWFHDVWPRSTRAMARQKIERHAEILAGMLERETGWASRPRHNINHVAVSALGISALVLLGESRDASAWLELAENALWSSLASMPTDGSSAEGVSYWGLSVESFLTLMLSNESHFRENRFFRFPFLQNAAAFRQHVSLPGFSENADYGDSVRFDWRGPGHLLRGLARVTNESRAQWLADTIESARSDATAWLRRPKHSWKGLFWYDPAIRPIRPDNVPLCFYSRELGIFIARTSWEPDASWVLVKAGQPHGQSAMLAGAPSPGHAQPDAGHVSYWAGGDWILIDDGYRPIRSSRTHNAWVINGKDQPGSGQRWLRVSPDKAGSVGMMRPPQVIGNDYTVLVDASSVYRAAADLDGLYRYVQLMKDGSLLIADSAVSDHPFDAETRWHFSDVLAKEDKRDTWRARSAAFTAATAVEPGTQIRVVEERLSRRPGELTSKKSRSILVFDHSRLQRHRSALYVAPRRRVESIAFTQSGDIRVGSGSNAKTITLPPVYAQNDGQR